MKFLIVILFIIVEASSLENVLYKAHKTLTNSSVLSREKRFLLYVPNGGIIKFVTGYLGPINIPSWQNINCLRNMQYQFELPTSWTPNSPAFPGWKGRSLESGGQKVIQADLSREIAYGLVERMLTK
jgi:hypothetical protein